MATLTFHDLDVDAIRFGELGKGSKGQKLVPTTMPGGAEERGHSSTTRCLLNCQQQRFTV